MDATLVLMGMENDTKLASLVGEGGTMPHSNQFSESEGDGGDKANIR